MNGPININTSLLKYDKEPRIQLKYKKVIYQNNSIDKLNLEYSGYESYIIYNKNIYYLRNIKFWK